LALLAIGTFIYLLPAIYAYARPRTFSIAAPLVALAGGEGIGSPGVERIFLVFLKIGAVLYGSGYVLIAFLQSDLVDERHWITQQQLLDAVAAGQVTPGPLFSTATFVGLNAASFVASSSISRCRFGASTSSALMFTTSSPGLLM